MGFPLLKLVLKWFGLGCFSKAHCQGCFIGNLVYLIPPKSTVLEPPGPLREEFSSAQWYMISYHIHIHLFCSCCIAAAWGKSVCGNKLLTSLVYFPWHCELQEDDTPEASD